MSNKTIIVIAPTKNSEPLKDELFERFGKDHDIVFADSFAAAMMTDKNTVFLIEPIDLPPPIPDLHVILQEHTINDVSLHASHLMNEGRDAEITNFNRSMYLHSKLVESFTKKDLGVTVDVVQTPVEDYTELLTRIVPTTQLRGEEANHLYVDDAPFQEQVPELAQITETESFKSETQEVDISGTINRIDVVEPKVEDLAQDITDNDLPASQTTDNYPQSTVTDAQPIPTLEEQPSVEFIKPIVEQGLS